MRLHAKFWAAVLAVSFFLVDALGQTAGTVSGDAIIYPKASSSLSVTGDTRPGTGSMVVVVVLALAAAGLWLWQKRRAQGGLALGGQKLAIAETKSLGNRQFLVVASYEDKKFLLSVCPGSIQLLTPLENQPEKRT